MQLLAGTFLKSTPALNGTVFENATVLITEYNSKGAVGYILNQPFHRNLNELQEFNGSPGFPLYNGGPVDKEHLFFVHKRPDLIEEGMTVNGIYNGGNFKQAVAAINNHRLTKDDIKIFVGYCGWDAGELEAEIKERSWTIASNSENVFME